MECGRRGGDRAAGRSRGLSARDTWRTVPPPPEASLLSLRVLKCVAVARCGAWVLRLQGADGFTRPSHRKPAPCRVDRCSTNPGAVVAQGDPRTATPGEGAMGATESAQRRHRRACDPRRRRLREWALCGGACGASGGGRMGRMAAGGGREGRGVGGREGRAEGQCLSPNPTPAQTGSQPLGAAEGLVWGTWGLTTHLHPPPPPPPACASARCPPTAALTRGPLLLLVPRDPPSDLMGGVRGQSCRQGTQGDLQARPPDLGLERGQASFPPPAPQPRLHTCRQGSWGRRPRHHGPRVPTASCAPAGSAPAGSAPATEACPPPRGCARPEHRLPCGPGPSPALAPWLRGSTAPTRQA